MKSLKSRSDLIKEYTKFFKSKDHKEIPSASLIPENDPTVLFTTAGMHPLVPYLLGQPHPLKTKRIVDVQKCIRTQDIDEVGNETHHTFFEMLGNWSLGDYFKEDAIKFSIEFLTEILKIPKEKLAISCFKGDKDAPKDTESAKVWESLGIPKERIAFLPKKDNWWGPAGLTGPCGPDTEMFYWSSKSKVPTKFDPENKKWVEIWNDVFMQYNKDEKGNFTPLKQQNVDTGMGTERTLAVLNGLEDNYLTSIFQPIIKTIEKISGKKYGKDKGQTRSMRIIADHIRTATFILADDKSIKPSNTEHGYILRRLIRRAIRYGKSLDIDKPFTAQVAKSVIPIYPDYEELKRNSKIVFEELEKEELRFSQTLEKGLRKFNSMSSDKKISGKEAFLLFQSYGFPLEMTQELAKEKKISVDDLGFSKEFEIHQSLSRTASEGKFKSGLADNSEQTTKLHTSTHILNEALRLVLKDPKISQKGSNINPERLRFDFNFDRKLTSEELEQIESEVNEIISKKLKVTKQEMPLKQAIKSGAQAEFGAKYPPVISVYTIEDPKDPRGFFSKEICTGPHVSNTGELGSFKILKEESVAAGIRRIKATVE
ncbi:alanine--tRNA ligase [Candidatus Pacearchaeota archaeon]|nr:alanine--tRNA ligase [Candidatus Pacearchaeota archaeon]|tara:strand:- start:2368 stop:4161 length:1794 start_codon:yes stop_codon:yes gene_type:complete